MDTTAKRSNRAEVRNPVLALPAFRRLQEFPPHIREAVAAVLVDLGADCQERADKSWATHKAPMAAYWKAVGVYARHFARALKKPQPAPTRCARDRILEDLEFQKHYHEELVTKWKAAKARGDLNAANQIWNEIRHQNGIVEGLSDALNYINDETRYRQ